VKPGKSASAQVSETAPRSVQTAGVFQGENRRVQELDSISRPSVRGRSEPYMVSALTMPAIDQLLMRSVQPDHKDDPLGRNIPVYEGYIFGGFFRSEGFAERRCRESPH
jgi:hypothetical protein